VHYTTLYRTFRKHVGLGPKQFGEIVRYYRFVGSLLISSGNDPQALLAALQGYYDQAHADRDFKRFTGVTPTSFRTTLNNIARLMHRNA
jgi:AraC-like DNA-binding protein